MKRKMNPFSEKSMQKESSLALLRSALAPLDASLAVCSLGKYYVKI